MKRIRLAGLATLISLNILILGMGVPQAQAQGPVVLGQRCCACLGEDCCLMVQGGECDPEGNLKNPALFLDIFESIGVDPAGFCGLCDQCALSGLSPEENEQYRDVCDICVHESIIEASKCSTVPPEVIESLFGEPSTGCGLGSGQGAPLGWTILIGTVLTLWGVRKRTATSP